MIRWAEIPRQPSATTLRQFSWLCLLIGGGGAVWAWWSGASALRITVLAILAGIGIVGVNAPALIRPVFVGWLMLTFPIGWLVSRAILLALFYGIFTPMAALFRRTGRDVLQLKPDPGRTSYWTPKGRSTGASYYRQY